MKKLICIGLLLLSGLTQAQSMKNYLNESDAEFNKRMQWFTDAKFGMFIHFGLYSELGGVWKNDTVEGYAEWIQGMMKIPSDEYSKLTETFNPKDFDADFIVKTAKEAGMKYLVVTSKHHEGFCLWNSDYTDFDVSATPFKRDILAELSAACKKYGLRFGTYYSIIDWHHPTQKHLYGLFEGAEAPADSTWRAEYIVYLKNQVRELIEKYDTDILWFDGDWEAWWNNEVGTDLYNYIRSLKPSIIINNRVAKRESFKKDFGTPEQEHLEEAVNYKWEACYTMNDSWGFKVSDHHWKSAEEVVAKLHDINEKGGNLLLNVGPDGLGRIPEPCVEILKQVGELLK
ncbi:alpha-L-fucosidase [Mangrovibacterium diazotrophicum]|uniref:alpha-L-fucosidase n=1 Tax=Mangrovibacterium diazotrophicum TaxID=1261403 RepID=A0A419VX93_9BACT|nr:alpha-L-fucosidase [Mangrovibacterium diazotrophicum]RKD87851.1 alpha-L-fucosidase [Mangrovibacterium diazotrophicum]